MARLVLPVPLLPQKTSGLPAGCSSWTRLSSRRTREFSGPTNSGSLAPFAARETVAVRAAEALAMVKVPLITEPSERAFSRRQIDRKSPEKEAAFELKSRPRIVALFAGDYED